MRDIYDKVICSACCCYIANPTFPVDQKFSKVIHESLFNSLPHPLTK